MTHKKLTIIGLVFSFGMTLWMILTFFWFPSYFIIGGAWKTSTAIPAALIAMSNKTSIKISYVAGIPLTIIIVMGIGFANYF